MKRSHHIILAAATLPMMFISGCINETLDPCPEATATVELRAETFGKEHSLPEEYEPVFGKRISSVHYSLYRNGTLLRERETGNLSGVATSGYKLDLGPLDRGNYTLLVSANTPAPHYESTASAPDAYAIKYRGPEQTKDYFSAVLPLAIDCDCAMAFEGTLRRLQGVVRATLYDIPANIAAAEIAIDNLSERKILFADRYDGTTTAALKQDITDFQRNKTSIVIGALPTADNERPSVCTLRLFDADGTAVHDEVISSSLYLKRNTLTDINIRFPNGSNGDITYEIIMDTSWDGQTNGGSTELE